MPENPFQTIGLIVRSRSAGHQAEIALISQALQQRGEMLVHYLDETACLEGFPHLPAQTLGENADLVVSIGGDGTLLAATRLMVDYKVPLVGINLGRLGFLADVTMQDLDCHLEGIFNGDYTVEKRFLLQGDVALHNAEGVSQVAFNDIILHSHKTVSMIEFEVFTNGQLINRQRADGLIVTTPTGSTAYSLSGGGPIMHPTLDVIALVPICPHTLSHRPIVLPANQTIEIRLAAHHSALVSFDGNTRAIAGELDRVSVQRYPSEITLLHPSSYDYFNILRSKLKWSNHP
jgi:NAD+ kinase